MTAPKEIQELVDQPVETLHVELKEWIDLSDNLVRAKTARHLAALANHGGGYFIVGMRDDRSLDESEHPGDLSRFNQDGFAGVIDRYLTPTFQCDVFFVVPAAGQKPCVIVRVPSHGSIPICAKANGPNDDKNRPSGIRKGEYYIRVPGPKSVVIDAPELWHPLIRRCVMADRQSLLESFGRVLNPSEATSSPEQLSLKDWHDAVREWYEESA